MKWKTILNRKESGHI